MDLNIIGENIVALRKKNRENQEELAKAIGSTRQTIGYWESGKGKDGITVMQLASIAEHYNVPITDFFVKNGENNEEPKDYSKGLKGSHFFRSKEFRKIINGKTYNTASAYNIVDYYNGVSNESFMILETLFMKENGEFFMFCEGGYNSIYAYHCDGGGFGNGWTIKPLSLNDTKEWLAERDEVEIYEKLFGCPEE